MSRTMLGDFLGKAIRPFGLLAIALLTPGLAACQSTCAGDPRVDGLGCATIGLSSGAYARQTQSMQSQAEQELAASAAALTQANIAQNQANSAAAQRFALQQTADEQTAEIARLKALLDAANARLAAARSRPQPDAAEIGRLETEIGALQRQIEALTGQ